MLASRHHDADTSRWDRGAMRAFNAARFMRTWVHPRNLTGLHEGIKPHPGMRTALRILVGTLAILCWSSQPAAGNLAEYRIKADFLVNFATFTEWPADVGKILTLCVYGPDPFGTELDRFQGRIVGGRSLTLLRVNSVDKLEDCQIVFVSRPAIDNLLRVLDNLGGKPVLTVADSPGATRQGVMLNMGTRQGRVTFEANLAAARDNGLTLSSKLLSLASEVRQ